MVHRPQSLKSSLHCLPHKQIEGTKRREHRKYCIVMMFQMIKWKNMYDKNAIKLKKKNRFLISINVLGSAGPIKFVINEDDSVSSIIHTALKSYAREGRLPVLGTDNNDFLLYSSNGGSNALKPWEKIGPWDGRNFMLCKKQPWTGAERPKTMQSCWRTWLNKSF